MITARVPDQAPDYIPALKHDLMDSDAIMRRYMFPYTPSGFWARLITRILLYVREGPIGNNTVSNVKTQKTLKFLGAYFDCIKHSRVKVRWGTIHLPYTNFQDCSL